MLSKILTTVSLAGFLVFTNGFAQSSVMLVHFDNVSGNCPIALQQAIQKDGVTLSFNMKNAPVAPGDDGDAVLLPQMGAISVLRPLVLSNEGISSKVGLMSHGQDVASLFGHTYTIEEVNLMGIGNNYESTFSIDVGSQASCYIKGNTVE